jgi:hypothetical protein
MENKPHFILTKTDLSRKPMADVSYIKPDHFWEKREEIVHTRWEEMTVTLHFSSSGNTSNIKDKKILEKIMKKLSKLS